MPAPLATAIAITGLGFVLVAIFGSALTKIGPVQVQNVDPPTRIKAGVIGGVLMVVAWWGLRQADGDNGVLISVYSPLDAATTEMVRDHARDAGLAIEFLGSEVRASGIVDLMRQVRSDWERGQAGDVILGGPAPSHERVSDLLEPLADEKFATPGTGGRGRPWVGWYRGWVGLVLDSGVATKLGLDNVRSVGWNRLIDALENHLTSENAVGLVFPDPSRRGSASLATHAIIETVQALEPASGATSPAGWLDRFRATLACNSTGAGDGLQAILDGRAVGVISWAHDLRREMDDRSLVGLVGPIILVRTPWEVGVVSVVRSTGPRDEAVYRFIELLLSEPIQREHTATGRRYPITNDEFAPNGLPPWSNVAPHIARDITDDMRRSEFRTRLDTLTALLQVGACGV